MKRLLILCLISSFNCFAWGPKGQTITAKVAEGYLSANAKSAIQTLLKGQELASFATWADQIRNDPKWKYTSVWHYINVSSNGTYDHGTPQEPDDVAKALNFCVEKISSDISNDEKAVWLKFVIHLVGDLHQPLHVGKPEDRGGNSTRVTYGKEFNLHALWDGAFIERQSLGVEDYVSKLKSQNKPTSELTKIFNADLIIQENFKLRDFVYSFKKSTIDSSYEAEATKITDDRLWVGGLRLASLLNGVFK